MVATAAAGVRMQAVGSSARRSGWTRRGCLARSMQASFSPEVCQEPIRRPTRRPEASRSPPSTSRSFSSTSSSSLPSSSTATSSTPDAPAPSSSSSLLSQNDRPARKVRASFRAGAFSGALVSDHPSRPSLNSLNRALAAQQNPDQEKPLLTRLHFAHSEEVVRHLEELLYPMRWEEEVACRMLTAKSAAKAVVEDRGLLPNGTHNAKLAFMGRRVLRFALSSFLASAPRDESLVLPPTASSPSSTSLSQKELDRILDSRASLGAFVGRAWSLEKIMRWREVSATNKLTVGGQLMGTGLYAARGEAVEAIMGGISSRHGTRLAIATFHSRVLPFLSHRLGPEYESAIEAVRRRDFDLSNPEAGIGPLDNLPVEEVADELEARNRAEERPRKKAAAATA